MIDELHKLSEEKEFAKKKTYAQANFYLPIFGKIYQDITGTSYWPTYGKDNAGLKDIINFLKKHDFKVEEFFIWACKNKANVIKRSCLTVLNEFKTEYIEYRKKNEF